MCLIFTSRPSNEFITKKNVLDLYKRLDLKKGLPQTSNLHTSNDSYFWICKSYRLARDQHCMVQGIKFSSHASYLHTKLWYHKVIKLDVSVRPIFTNSVTLIICMQILVTGNYPKQHARTTTILLSYYII